MYMFYYEMIKKEIKICFLHDFNSGVHLEKVKVKKCLNTITNTPTIKYIFLNLTKYVLSPFEYC